MSTSTEIENEILARSRRIETRLHRICTHFDIAEAPNNGVLVTLEGGRLVADVKGMDISLSAIKREVSRSGFDPYALGVLIKIDGECKCYLEFERE